MAGSTRAARQVVRILHTYSDKEGLPWHRVVNREGRIALKPGQGYEEQRRLLELEGIELDHRDRIDLGRFLWRPFDTESRSKARPSKEVPLVDHTGKWKGPDR